MIVEKKNGGLLIYELKNNYLHSEFYLGFTQKEAKRDFNEKNAHNRNNFERKGLFYRR